MRAIGAMLVLTGVLAAGCGSDGPSAAECPPMAADFRSYIGENDDPAPESLVRLSAQWEDIYRELGTLRKSSQGEACSERLPQIKREIAGIDDLSYGLQGFDPAERSGEADEVRRYVADKRLDGDDGPRNAAEVDRLAPAAQAALGPALKAADDTDPADKGAVRDALAAVEKIATSDPAARAWLSALEKLDVGEYDEP